MESTTTSDLAIIILAQEKSNAVEGVDYAKPWFGDESDIVGQEFMLTGWGYSGEISEDHYA